MQQGNGLQSKRVIILGESYGIWTVGGGAGVISGSQCRSRLKQP
jgi:hypothetical protein